MTSKKSIPPRLAQRILISFLRHDLVEEVQGDLEEKFYKKAAEKSPFRARIVYCYEVFNYLRPFAIKKLSPYNSNYNLMYTHYFKISLRHLLKNKGYSFINIGGLAIGMAVAVLIGLWVHNETSYDKYHKNYDNIAQVMTQQTFNGQVHSDITGMARPVEFIFRNQYADKFKRIVMSSWVQKRVLANGQTKIHKSGRFMQKDVGAMLSLKIKSGLLNGLEDPKSIMIASSTAKALFGDEDPIDRILKLDNKHEFKVTAVYEDLPKNTSFNNLEFIVPWSFFLTTANWIQESETKWDNSFLAYVEISDQTTMDQVTATIKDIPKGKSDHLTETKAAYFLHPMSDWHLRSSWKNGRQVGGNIIFVRLFGAIGGFVLLLACINFMNLSTARSEKRALEVGIRKAVGSGKNQLVWQFLNESFLVVIIAFLAAILLVFVALPYFNQLSAKTIVFPWRFIPFWLISLGFIIITSIISGSYPSFYLSSFRPNKALKGVYKTGRRTSTPRKVLVVFQFVVSVTLIIGTIVVYQQIEHTKNRPIGYNKEGLIQIQSSGYDFKWKYGRFRNTFLASEYVSEMAGSLSPTTNVAYNNSGYSWEGKPDGFQDSFDILRISHEYGSTIGWEIREGRDFSRDFGSDSTACIINESAVAYMGIENPIGKYIKGDYPMQIIGVVKDMVMESPFSKVNQAIYFLDHPYNYYLIRLNPEKSAQENLVGIEEAFHSVLPDVPFAYQFVDDVYAVKFHEEERIGQLAGIFTVLAIFISCLGLFGLASFVAEQRTKEIGIRKILGATVLNLWKLLSKDFLIMVFISCFIAGPIAYYYMKNWLNQYEYRIDFSWWVFILAGAVALLLTMLTVSYQTIKAALVNPINSLKSE